MIFHLNNPIIIINQNQQTMKKLLLLLTLLIAFGVNSQQSAPEGMVLINRTEVEIPTNHPILEEVVKEWESSAKAFNEPNQIDYLEIFRTIKGVKYQDLPLDTYWAVTKSGEIYINIRFIEYKHLTRVMVYQAIGYVYGLPFEERGRLFMSETWKPTEKEDGYAKNNARGFSQKRIYFEKLARKYPINFYKKI